MEIGIYEIKILKVKSYDLFRIIQDLWYTTHLLLKLFRLLTTGPSEEVGEEEAVRRHLLPPARIF